MPEPPQDPRLRATALRYDPEGRPGRPPSVTAAGAGLVAERIVEAARAAGVPVREDPALAGMLASLKLGAEIPEPLWRAVAETLAWAYRLDASARPGGRRS